MTKQEKQFWKICQDRYKQVLETDSYIYRFYINPLQTNIGVFYDKLKDKWDTAWVKNGKIVTRNIHLNTKVHQLKVLDFAI